MLSGRDPKSSVTVLVAATASFAPLTLKQLSRAVGVVCAEPPMDAESQSKKAAFLQEAVRSLELSASVFAGRAETLNEQFDCVALRAVDRMEQAVAAASVLVRSGGLLVVFTTHADLAIPGDARNSWQQSQLIPIVGSEQRLLALFSKTEA